MKKNTAKNHNEEMKVNVGNGECDQGHKTIIQNSIFDKFCGFCHQLGQSHEFCQKCNTYICCSCLALSRKEKHNFRVASRFEKYIRSGHSDKVIDFIANNSDDNVNNDFDLIFNQWKDNQTDESLITIAIGANDKQLVQNILQQCSKYQVL